MKNKDIVQLTKKYQFTDLSFPASFDSAQGVRFRDIEGKEYFDMSSGYGVVNVGWQHPKMVKALQDQAAKSCYSPPWMVSEESAHLSEALCNRMPQSGYKSFRATGGSDANEIARKVISSHFGSANILSFYRSYHGGSHASLGISDIKAFRLPYVIKEFKEYKVDPHYCLRCPFKKEPSTCAFECTRQIAELFELHSDIKIFFVEPILGSGGVITPPKDYFKRVSEICRSFNVALVFDEVLTGNGRTGHYLAADYFDVKPDGITLAKGLASGFAAIGAALIQEQYIQHFTQYDDVSSSFAWNPLACALAWKNLEILEEEKLIENAKVQGNYLKAHFTDLLRKHYPDQFGEVRGLGLMLGCELVNNHTEKSSNQKLHMRILLGMLRRGVMWCASWDYNTMIALPPLVITRAECDEVLNVLELTISGK
jgi:4-aminobutyrate aminotransferase-like enzyme